MTGAIDHIDLFRRNAAFMSPLPCRVIESDRVNAALMIVAENPAIEITRGQLDILFRTADLMAHGAILARRGDRLWGAPVFQFRPMDLALAQGRVADPGGFHIAGAAIDDRLNPTQICEALYRMSCRFMLAHEEAHLRLGHLDEGHTAVTKQALWLDEVQADCVALDQLLDAGDLQLDRAANGVRALEVALIVMATILACFSRHLLVDDSGGVSCPHGAPLRRIAYAIVHLEAVENARANGPDVATVRGVSIVFDWIAQASLKFPFIGSVLDIPQSEDWEIAQNVYNAEKDNLRSAP